jgi:L-ascorbate metabolism protein UlaG (beta-lactamase superfamily)
VTSVREGRKLAPRVGEAGIWWLGQSTVALRGAHANVLIDPFLTPHPDRLVPPAFGPREVGGLNAVLITHEHWDHFDADAMPGLADASPHATFVVPEPLVDATVALGIDAARVVGAQPDRAVELDGVTVHPVPACHGLEPADAYTFGQELSDGLYRYLGYVVDLGRVRIYHAGDTIPFDGLEAKLRELAVDVALLPINGRDAEREAQGIVGNMDAREAAHVAEASGADVVVPIHFDMFEANPGDPGALVDAVVRERLDVGVLVLSRARPYLYTRGQS